MRRTRKCVQVGLSWHTSTDSASPYYDSSALEAMKTCMPRELRETVKRR